MLFCRSLPRTITQRSLGDTLPPAVLSLVNHPTPLFPMIYYRLVTAAILSVSTLSFAASPLLPGIGAAMQEMVDKQEIAGAVTAVVTVDRTLHLESTGHADLASHRAMTPDTLFWIASMTKPVTGVAIMMLQDPWSPAERAPRASLPILRSSKFSPTRPALGRRPARPRNRRALWPTSCRSGSRPRCSSSPAPNGNTASPASTSPAGSSRS